MSRDGLAGLAILVASLVLFWLTLDLKENPMVPLGPGFYPRLVLGLTALLSLGLVVSDLLRKDKAKAEKRTDSPNYKLVALSFGVFALYCAALPGLGFRIATFAYVVVSSSLLAPPRGLKGWAGVLVLGAATSAVTWLIFERELSVLLPRGRWTQF